MGTLLSLEQFSERIKDRGITVLSYGGKATAKSDFQCAFGHVWTAKGSSVTSGVGCPVCGGTQKIDIDKAYSDFEDRGIKLIKAYGRSVDPADFSCLECGYHWTTTLGAVFRGSGCRKCKGLVKKTLQEANDSISHRGITISDYCGKSTGISTFLCKCGNQWKTTLTSVLTGRGCSSCASYGFDKNKPATFYIYKITGAIRFVGYGVTNSYKSRKQKHTETFKKLGLHFDEVALFNFKTGKEALALEDFLKSKYKDFSVDVKSFRTESAPIEALSNIVECALLAKEADLNSQNESTIG